MCILFVALNQHPDYSLLVCANRDEFHQRPSLPAHFWPERHLLAGQDLQQGGTWLGVNSKGQFAALTNLRQGLAQDSSKRSRGDLVLQALSGDQGKVAQSLRTQADQYNGFNLVFSHHSQSGDIALTSFNSHLNQLQSLSSGCHAICNGPINQAWPKMAKGERALEDLLKDAHPLEPEALFALMQDKQVAPDELLPDTGVGLEWERRLSPIFIQGAQYGTRCTSLYWQDKQGNREFWERRYDAQGQTLGTSRFVL
ncbi:NRDE family protein [Paraferrimonas sedimenticola]|uniref:NRDE family protein n=1 Tax=Paraferrimonas sedimenticola TaxID=375674 RepID=A0AA37RZD4_9GAMM|nr:NRDE family protein [Paraferrimonas sedimenticola]GLP97814.1 hypothetical protein GCM10007895_31210 [Paraferrimonas sedimenticola]